MRPVGQAAKTPPSHGGNGSSILPRVTMQQRPLILSTVFVFLLCEGRQRPRNEQFPTLHVPRYRAHCLRRPALSPCTARAPALTHLHRPHPPHALAEHRPHIRTTRPPRHAYPSLTLLRSLIYPPFLSHPPRTALHPSRATRTSPAPRKKSARLPTEILKLQAFSFFAKHFKLCRQLAERK